MLSCGFEAVDPVCCSLHESVTTSDIQSSGLHRITLTSKGDFHCATDMVSSLSSSRKVDVRHCVYAIKSPMLGDLEHQAHKAL